MATFSIKTLELAYLDFADATVHKNCHNILSGYKDAKWIINFKIYLYIYFLKMNFTMILSKKDSSKINIEYIRRQNL